MLGRQVDGPTKVAQPARPSARRIALWSGGIGALALAAGLAWMAHVDSTEPAAAAAVWSANDGARPAAPATADAAPGVAPEAGAAARINDEATGGASLTASLEKDNPQTLREMLSAKPAPTPAPGAGVDILSKALASPSASERAKAAPKAKPKAPAKDEAGLRARDIGTAKAHGDRVTSKTAANNPAAVKHHGKLAAKAAPSKTREARLAMLRARKAQQTLLAAKAAKAARHAHGHQGQALAKQGQALAKKSPPAARAEPDSDVTLLAALVAHAQAHPSGAAGTTQARLKQCKPMKNVNAEQCRAQVCAGRWKSDADCKALPAGQEPPAKSS